MVSNLLLQSFNFFRQMQYMLPYPDVLPRTACRRAGVLAGRLLAGIVVTEPINQRRNEARTIDDFLRVQIYIQSYKIDTVSTELNQRFPDDNIAVMCAVCA